MPPEVTRVRMALCGLGPAFPVVDQVDVDVFFEIRCAGVQVGIFLCAAASGHADAVEEFEVSPTRIELSSRLTRSNCSSPRKRPLENLVT
ncbi:MAG: hypothetical protein CM1200mP2_59180 [Planctomycetaceae bacterium]|nr:MAG: hypothetical protein CM1200mP2_59180 [Planctomycetaceae bacterium]